MSSAELRIADLQQRLLRQEYELSAVRIVLTQLLAQWAIGTGDHRAFARTIKDQVKAHLSPGDTPAQQKAMTTIAAFATQLLDQIENIQIVEPPAKA